VLHQERFTSGRTTALQRIPFVATSEIVNEEYPLLLVTGRRLYHFNAGTMTYRTPNRELEPEDRLDISPGDATQFHLTDGQRVTITSRHGEATLALRITDRQKRGELFTSFHKPDLFVNHLTSSVRDRLTRAPEYKVTAVRINRPLQDPDR